MKIIVIEITALVILLLIVAFFVGKKTGADEERLIAFKDGVNTGIKDACVIFVRGDMLKWPDKLRGQFTNCVFVKVEYPKKLVDLTGAEGVTMTNCGIFGESIPVDFDYALASRSEKP